MRRKIKKNLWDQGKSLWLRTNSKSKHDISSSSLVKRSTFPQERKSTHTQWENLQKRSAAITTFIAKLNKKRLTGDVTNMHRTLFSNLVPRPSLLFLPCHGSTNQFPLNFQFNCLSMAKTSKQSNDRELFDSFFAELVDDIVKENENDEETADAARHMREVLEYNVPGGKRNRGLSVIGSLRHLVSPDKLTEEDAKTAIILGWCVEWLQAFFLVADDIMDESLTRRGKPCWYKKDGIGNIAINDFLLIEATIYKLLKKHVYHRPYYVDVLDLFHEVTYQTATGQTLDLITKPGVNFENFTVERYKAIVKYKTAFYSFYLPVALAMYMAGIKDTPSHENAKEILLEMGEFFQIQDDYLDCYGDPAVTGKVGTDIEENKCSWLIVQALQRISTGQMQILKENYGVKDIASSEKVKALYHELNLKQIYKEYEEASYKSILELISQKSANLPREMFLEFVKKIYKRDK